MRFTWKKAVMVCAVSLFALPGIAQDSPSSAAHPGAAELAAPVRTITIVAKKYVFDPAEITLTKGQTVKLELTSDDVKHSLLVPGLGIDEIMKKGKMTEAVVTPDKTGDFKGKCGVFCGFGHDHMHFVVHVVDQSGL